MGLVETVEDGGVGVVEGVLEAGTDYGQGGAGLGEEGCRGRGFAAVVSQLEVVEFGEVGVFEEAGFNGLIDVSGEEEAPGKPLPQPPAVTATAAMAQARGMPVAPRPRKI